MYFTNWFEQMQSVGSIHSVSDYEGCDNVIVADHLPTVDDILSYINSFISYHKKSKKNILKYYFIIDAFAKLAKLFKDSTITFAINIKKLYELFVKAIQKRINNQMFYIDSVESIEDTAIQVLNTIKENIGKDNVIMFNAA